MTQAYLPSIQNSLADGYAREIGGVQFRTNGTDSTESVEAENRRLSISMVDKASMLITNHQEETQ